MYTWRSELARQVVAEQAKQVQLQAQLYTLTKRLASSGEKLAELLAACAKLDRTIAETKASYSKILENPQALGGVLKEEAGNAGKASEPQSTSEEENQIREQKHS